MATTAIAMNPEALAPILDNDCVIVTAMTIRKGSSKHTAKAIVTVPPEDPATMRVLIAIVHDLQLA
eukprot:CAMPEP_0172916162 /NCGR_PEP_ID=MMETSP1075-20121228/195793_1 /TAXON_ID=2916 /ORGANISM="Ceratium fusus, Strain PA161109" /LENGTH=65 /DNA_ID=CAMNT_0013775403 /DNA_START=19 /DNA_END=217 /DNA_ORIENTATION=-